MKRTLLVLLVGWLLGIATALGGVAVTGGWYEYHFSATSEEYRSMINDQGWWPDGGALLKRPRFLLGW